MPRKRTNGRNVVGLAPSTSPGIPSNFEDALNYLELNINEIKRDGLIAAVNIIGELASTLGLREETLCSLVDIIGSCKFSVTISKKLVSFLTPCVAVPEDAIISALSWICTRKMSLTIQASLMQWIIAAYTYDVIDRTNRLHLLYEIVFCLLQYDDLCPHICHFLFLLTRKENVKLYHIQKLIRLQSRLGSQTYIIGLLNMYHQFRPDYFSIRSKSLKSFRVVKQWEHLSVPRRAASSGNVVLPTTKRNEKQLVEYKGLVSVMEASKNTATVLNSQHRRLLITSCEDVVAKLNLQFMLQVEYEWYNERNDKQGRELLKTMADVFSETQEGLTTKDYSHMFHCLKTWDGRKFFPEVLRVIPHFFGELTTVDELTDAFAGLNSILRTSSASFQLEVLANLSCLFKNCVLLKYSPEEIVRYQDSSSTHEFQDLLLHLASYIDNLCIYGSLQHPDKEGSFLFIGLDFYSLVLHLVELGYLDLLIVPSASLVCGSLFSFSASHLSQLCMLLARYQKAAMKLKDASRDNTSSQRLMNGIKSLNNYILDTSNTLWRCKGFIPSPNSCVFEDKLPAIVQEAVEEPKEAFAIYRHPALLLAAREFLEKLKDEGVRPRDIVSNPLIKDAFLQHINTYNFFGIILFVQTFMKSKSKYNL